MYRYVVSLTALLFSTTFLWTSPAVASSSPREVKCALNPIQRHHNSKPQEQKIFPHIPIREGTSSNWSGYVAATSLSNPRLNTVSTVYGSWIVPQVTGSPSADTYSSFWVGIDGYSSDTVEQLGTEQDWVNGTQQNYAWFEMYPLGAYEIVGFPVDAGDSISAYVTYTGNSVFKLNMTNNTKGVTVTIPKSYTTSPHASRSSAEWILEAPYDDGVLPLADFGVASFMDCTATINGFSGAINDPNWQHEPLTMETSTSIIKSLPSSLFDYGQAFTLQWEHE
jgi:Peptidase A4 family